jgi:3'(2'), 5'-bisphosphate nucleotidase
VGLSCPGGGGPRGLPTSRIDGSPLVYNQENVLLPDLVVCRPELAQPILDYIRRTGVE